jgi:threonylcarbamoyladenosine tRNA methylthiotransferase MtaB
MKTFAINTLGCKVNQYESQQIRELLERLGLDHAEIADRPDLVVINTCCVTHIASAKSRQYIRKAQKLSPDAVIVVSGCLPTVQIGELNDSDKNIHPVRHRETVAATLSHIINDKAARSESQNTIIKAKNCAKIKCKIELTNPPKLAQLTSFKGHTRAYLKIQDGCDGYCTYCIVPKTRSFVHSKPAEAVLQEAQALVAAGHKEIVVTGIFLGAYGQKSVRRKNWIGRQNDKLADLLDKMGKIPNLARIRLSSLEPGDVTPRLLDTFCKHHNIMPHLHLSLQSGSNAVLKKMHRQYNIDEFISAVELIKSRLDRPAITTDIIVGFPGETDSDFEATVDSAKEAGFAKMHVFSFSKRAGTAAADMQDVIDNKVIKSRSQILRDLDTELGGKFRQQFIGEKDEILVEESDGECKGRSKRYFMVQLKKTDGNLQRGELVRVKLVKNGGNGVIGQVIMPIKRVDLCAKG